MRVTPLTLRNQKGSALNADEFDGNLVALRDFANALSARIDVVLDSAGRLRGGTVGTNALVNRCVTQPKLAWHANFYGVATGTNAYSVTFSPTDSFSLGDGAASSFGCIVKFTNANTTAVTLDVNGAGATPVKKKGGEALTGGEIAAGSVHCLFYDGTNFQLVGAIGTGIERAEYDGDYRLVTMKVIQNAATDSVSGASGVIPVDGSIPQSDEGKEFITFSFTPRRADTRIMIEFDSAMYAGSGDSIAVVAMFKDSEADAIVAQRIVLNNATGTPVRLAYDVASWGADTSADFAIRFGCDDTGDTTYINGATSTVGDTMRNTVKITEYIAEAVV